MRSSLTLSLLLLAIGPGWAQDAPTPAPQEPAPQEEAGVIVGDAAPEFTALDQAGKSWKSSEHFAKGKYTVVYFYPGDLTPGCTLQACGYRDHLAGMRKEGIEVVGVSGDSVENHAAFAKEKKLGFTLLADPKGELAEAFGVPSRPGGESQVQLGGKATTFTRGVTSRRYTFVISPKGQVVYRGERSDPARGARRIRFWIATKEKTVRRELPDSLAAWLKEAIAQLEAGDAKGFIKERCHPSDLEDILQQATLEQLAQRFASKLDGVKLTLGHCLDFKPEVLPAGDVAVFRKVAGGPNEIAFEQVAGKWYLRNR